MLIILYAHDSDGKSLLDYAKSRNRFLTEKAILDISENEENKKLAYAVMSETRNSKSTVYNTINDELLSQIIYSPLACCFIAVGTVLGALALYFLASLIFGIL